MPAWATGSRSARKRPWDGEPRLTSAIRRTRSPAAGRRAASKSRAGPSPRQAAIRSGRGRRGLSSASSERLWATISSRTPMRLVVAAQPVVPPRDVDARHLLHHVLAQRARRRQVAREAAARDQRLEERFGGPPVGAHRRGGGGGKHHVLQRAREPPHLLGPGALAALGHR